MMKQIGAFWLSSWIRSLWLIFREMLDLVKGRLILTDLVERNSVPIFSDIDKALNCTNLVATKVRLDPLCY